MQIILSEKKWLVLFDECAYKFIQDLLLADYVSKNETLHICTFKEISVFLLFVMIL